MLKTILYIVAVIFFAIDFFHVPAPVNWTAGAWALVVTATFLV
jgi:hypothetical protein